MFKADEEILRAYFRMEEYQRERLRLERIWHPEKFNWSGPVPLISATKLIKREEFEKMGVGENRYQRMLEGETNAKAELEKLAEEHPLWSHFELIAGLGKYLCGAFIAAGGDITRAPTASAFWKGMGLDVLPDGTVPRRIRGRKDVERRVPALPHVTRIGEQIRQQILKSNGRLRELYDRYREYYDAKYPDRAKMFNFKAALRASQKILYACLWEKWRMAYGLPAPWPYAFDILKHAEGGRITMSDLYDKEPARVG